MEELQTIIYNQRNVRVSIDEWHGGLWLNLQAENASLHTTFTREEAEELLKGLQKILDKEVV